MSLREKHLAEGEVVVLRLRTHVKVLIRPILMLIALGLIPGIAAVVVPEEWARGWVVLVLAALAILAIAVWVVAPVLRWATTSYIVTTKRIVTRSGIITRIGRDIPLYRINDINSERHLLDRVFGCGTLIVSDATGKSGMVLRDVPRVQEVKARLHSLLFAHDDGSDDGEWPPGEPRHGPRSPTS